MSKISRIDSQLYKNFDPDDPDDVAAVITCIEKAASDVEMWMYANLHKLNAHKTEMLIFGPARQLLKVQPEYDHSLWIGKKATRGVLLDIFKFVLEHHFVL